MSTCRIMLAMVVKVCRPFSSPPPHNITDSAPNRPDNLIITIQLPKLQNSKNIKLDVQDRSLTLKTESEEPSYSLKVELPYQIDSSNGANAKYKKEQVHSKIVIHT